MSDNPEALPELPEPYDVLELWGQNVSVYCDAQMRAYARAALAQQAATPAPAEPVAWLLTGGRTFADTPYMTKQAADGNAMQRGDGSHVVPLYAAPPATPAAQPADDARDAAMWRYWKPWLEWRVDLSKYSPMEPLEGQG